MEKKSFRLHSLIFMSALLFMMVFHAKAEAATVIYVRKGVTGDFSFVRAPYPNSKWKVTAGKSCLKLKSSTSKKAVYYGKKVGQATLTVYNKNNPSQKMISPFMLCHLENSIRWILKCMEDGLFLRE